jgi:hypothetical protein
MDLSRLNADISSFVLLAGWETIRPRQHRSVGKIETLAQPPSHPNRFAGRMRGGVLFLKNLPQLFSAEEESLDEDYDANPNQYE